MKFNQWLCISLACSLFALASPRLSLAYCTPKNVCVADDKQTGNAACCCAEGADQSMDESLQIRGIVISKPDAGFVRLSIGVLQNVRPDAEIAFFKGGKRIGSSQALKVDWGDTLVAVSEDVYQQVQIGTPVRVVSNPARAARRTEPEKRIRAESRAGLDPSSR